MPHTPTRYSRAAALAPRPTRELQRRLPSHLPFFGNRAPQLIFSFPLCPKTLDPVPHTLYPIPYTLYPIPYTLYPIPYTLYPIPYTPYPIPYTLYPILYTLYPIPYTLYPIPYTLNPIPFTLYPIPCTLYPKSLFLRNSAPCTGWRRKMRARCSGQYRFPKP